MTVVRRLVAVVLVLLCFQVVLAGPLELHVMCIPQKA